MGNATDANVLGLTAQIVAAHAEHNQIGADALLDLIHSVYLSLATANLSEARQANTPKSAFSVRRSVFPDFIICLEDGRKLKMLKRHLRASYGVSPDDYRAKWGLPPDYPMVAPNYAATRSALAKAIGLGHRVPAEVGQVETAGSEESKVTVVPSRRNRG